MANTITGTNKDDVLDGTIGNNIFHGLRGADIAFGNGGEDFFDMGPGDDVAYGGNESDRFDMGKGDDIAFGYGGNDFFDMGAGDDTAYGGEGADYFDLGAGDDVAYGGDFDWFDPGAGDDTLFGGQGSVAYGSKGNDTYIGVENLFFFGFASELAPEEEPPTFGPSGVTVDLEAGWAIDTWGDTDTIVGAKDVFGSAYADVIYGDEQDNFFNGVTGADAFYGREGSDTVTYNTDRKAEGDTSSSGMTIDLQFGHAVTIGGDFEVLDSIENIRASHYNDIVIGSDADNTIMGLDGADTLDGGDGSDTLRYDRDAVLQSPVNGFGTLGVRVYLAPDADEGVVQSVAFDGYGNEDSISNFENVIGTNQQDRLWGDAGDNVLTGLDGNDRIRGKEGNDTLNCGDGDDRPDGGEGNDLIWGGAGEDRFQFGTFNAGNDVIHDFDYYEDDTLFFHLESQVDCLSDLNISQEVDGALVTFAGGSVLLLGVDATMLLDYQDDIFLFA